MDVTAAVVGALGAALLLLSRSRAELLAGLGLLAAATVGLLAAASPDADLGSLVSPAGIAAIATAGGLLVAVAGALVRYPEAVTPLLLVVAPLRLPIETDPSNTVVFGLAGTGGLGRLYPFYAALAAAVLALVWRTLRGTDPGPLPRMFAIPAALFFALTAISLVWSSDPAASADQLAFFWFPFALLIAVVAKAPVSPHALAVALVGVAAVFAAIGIGQAITERLLFFNVALERANELGPFFRVTSAFQDPNHYGRHLVLAIAAVLAALWAGRARLGRALAVTALLAAGLYFSYSQSSMVALIVVALALAVAAGDRRVRRVTLAVGVALVAGGAVALAAGVGGGSAASFTSDRSTLVGDTAAVFAAHPVVGVGVGAQPLVTRDEEAPDTAVIQNASHTTPLTVAAELGLLGLAAFLALLVGAALLLGAVRRVDPALALGLGAVLLALLVHSLFYGGLFENPITFGALGVAAAAVGGDTRARPPRRASVLETASRGGIMARVRGPAR